MTEHATWIVALIGAVSTVVSGVLGRQSKREEHEITGARILLEALAKERAACEHERQAFEAMRDEREAEREACEERIKIEVALIRAECKEEREQDREELAELRRKVDKISDPPLPWPHV